MTWKNLEHAWAENRLLVAEVKKLKEEKDRLEFTVKVLQQIMASHEREKFQHKHLVINSDTVYR
jgi:hypothetical protein